jgi:hypothetical protein
LSTREEGEEYYIVSVDLKKVTGVNGNALTLEGAVGWLSMTEDCYPKIQTLKALAKKFKEKPNLNGLNDWDGMPWYCRIKPGSAKIYKVQTTKTITETYEEAVV